MGYKELQRALGFGGKKRAKEALRTREELLTATRTEAEQLIHPFMEHAKTVPGSPEGRMLVRIGVNVARHSFPHREWNGFARRNGCL